MRLSLIASPPGPSYTAFMSGYTASLGGTPISGNPCHSPVGKGGDGNGAGRARRGFSGSVFELPLEWPLLPTLLLPLAPLLPLAAFVQSALPLEFFLSSLKNSSQYAFTSRRRNPCL